MTPSQALNAVSAVYVPGVAKYYNALTPDPWFAAHETLERSMFAGEDVSSACEQFVARCTELIERFKREGTPSKGMSIADAVNMGSNWKPWDSKKKKSCIYCGATDGITLSRVKGAVVIVCTPCKQGSAA